MDILGAISGVASGLGGGSKSDSGATTSTNVINFGSGDGKSTLDSMLAYANGDSPASSSAMPWLIVGGVALVGIALLMKRSK